MDLSLQDVADALSVSKETIETLAVTSLIPSYRLAENLRFNRFEVESWMVHKFQEDKFYSLKKQTRSIGSKRYALTRALAKGMSHYLTDIPTQKQILQVVSSHIASHLELETSIVFTELYERESISSTSINEYIALPHAKDLINLKADGCIFVFYLNSNCLFEVEKKIHTLLVPTAKNDSHHLLLMSKLASFCHEPQNISFLKTKPTIQNLIHFCMKWESSFNKAT